MQSVSKCLVLNFLLHLSFFSSLGAGPDTYIDRRAFLKWLNLKDPVVAKEIIRKASVEFRKEFGTATTRFSDPEKTQWNESFLDIANREFDIGFGTSIDSLSRAANAEMIQAISSSRSRYRGSKENEDFDLVFQDYLESDYELLKRGSEFGVAVGNKWKWSVALEKMVEGESVGGIQSFGIGFLCDRAGRILYAGSIRGIPAHLRPLVMEGFLFPGLVNVGGSNHALFHPVLEKIPAEARQPLLDAFKGVHGTQPVLEHELFLLECRHSMGALVEAK